jgi:ectoine hydroxylase-related dioxygenase (phytanoyl-CoA dioxygenase family)
MDQNVFDKPDLCCVQGMVLLYNVTEGTGGLSVVPRSHLDRTIQSRHPHWRLGGDFCVLSTEDPSQKKKKLLIANAGDVILWDSRTVHGGLVGTGGDYVLVSLSR